MGSNATSYRVRCSWSGLDGADETDGGDRYRVQVWPGPAREPKVLRWWPQWDPSGVVPQLTTTGGRLLVGAEAEDRRRAMSWLAARGSAHLFRDDDGTYWEHSNLPSASGTPQLEELDVAEAERRYGPRSGWGPAAAKRPSALDLIRNTWRTWRYSHGRRPPGVD
jgi:hypothetical protein